MRATRGPRRVLQRALDRLDPVTLDDIADLHVLVVLERHAAFLAGGHLARVVLEALELAELAFVHHHAVADEPNIGAALDGAVGYAAAGDVADLGDLEDLKDSGVAQHGLAPHRREQAGHRLLHIIHEIVDDVVVADLDAGALGALARFLVGAHVEADDRGVRGFGEPYVRFGDAADARDDDPSRDFRRAELLERSDDRLDRALHIALDHQREPLTTRGLGLRHHLFERATHTRGTRCRLLALLAGTIVRDLAGARLVVDDGEAVARFRRAVEAEHLDRRRGTRRDHRHAGIGHERAHPAPFGTGNHDVAGLERAALDQHGRDRAAATVKLRLDHCAFGWPLRIGLELENFSLQPDGLEQAIEIEL